MATKMHVQPITVKTTPSQRRKKAKTKSSFKLFKRKPKKDKKADKEKVSAQHISGYKTVKQQRLADEQNKDHSKPKLNQLVLARQELKGVSRWIGDNELDMLVKMQTSDESIRRRMRARVTLSGFVLGVSLVVGIVFHKYFLALIGLGVLLAALCWFLDIRRTNTYYRTYQLERQIAFAQFTRLSAAYLPELSHGANLYSVFRKILPRMDNKRDHASLETLMIDMQVDPEDPGPFLKFAHDFSVSDRAELIMLSIQQMYLGDVDDDNIRALAEDANEDMMRQIDDIIASKIRKFNNLTTRIAMCSMIIIFGFFGLLMVATFKEVFSTLTNHVQV